MGFKNQFQRILEARTVGPAFGYRKFIDGNLSGDIIMASGDMSAEEFNAWRQANPQTDEELQAQGRALTIELDGLFDRFSVAHGEAVGLATSVQHLSPAETVALGNSFLEIINGLAVGHDSLKEEYATALNRKPYTNIEDFIALIPRVNNLVNRMESYRDRLRESVSDPRKAKELANETKSENALDQIGSIVKWAAIGGIGYIVLKTFLPDIRNMITKKSQA